MITCCENRIIYKGDGETTKFSYPFVIIDDTDLFVMTVSDKGEETVLTSDYYIDRKAGCVYYPGYAPGAEEPEADRPPILPEGWNLVLYRYVPINQLAEMPNNWPFDVNEDMHDKSCIIDQQLQDGFTRCLHVGVATDMDVSTRVPVGADKIFVWNDTGTALRLADNPETFIEDALAEMRAEYEARLAEQDARIQALEADMATLHTADMERILEAVAQLNDIAAQVSNALLYNYRYAVNETIERRPNQPTWGVEDADIAYNVPDTVRITVTGDSADLNDTVAKDGE